MQLDAEIKQRWTRLHFDAHFKLVMISKIGIYTEYHLVYETKYEGFEIRILRVGPSMYYILNYKELYSGL